MCKNAFQYFVKYKLQIILICCGLLASFLCWSRVHFFTFFLGDFAVRYFDTDDFMMIVRIRDFFQHFDLANHVIARANFPYGGDMHWTRIYDFFLIIPAWILNIFLNDINKSTELIGLIISPIVKCALILACFNLFKNISKERAAAFLITLLIAINPAINYTNMFARPDHHAFTMLMMALYLLYLEKSCEANFKSDFCNAKTGVIAALCVWTTPETLIFLLLSDVLIFLYAFNDTEKMLGARRKCLWTMLTIAIIVVVFRPFDITTLLFIMFSIFGAAAIFKKNLGLCVIFAVLAIGSVFNTLPIEYDTISIVHLVLYVALTGFFALSTRFDQFWKKCLVGAIIGIAFLALFPKFLYGMEAGISDSLREVWFLNNVDEMKSPLSFGKEVSAYFLIFIVISSVAIYDKICHLLAKTREESDFMWWLIIINCICYMIFACIADRMRATLAFFSMPLVVEFGINCAFIKLLPRYAKIALICILALGTDVIQKYFPILMLYYKEGAAAFEQFCKTRKDMYEQEDRFFKILDEVSEKPVTIFTYLGKAAATLYYTKHNVVATPYHRHEQGIIAYYQVMESPYNEAIVKDILKKTQTDYVFISKGMSFSTAKYIQAFGGMVARGSCPEWADIVSIPFEFEDVVLLKINHKML